MLVVGTVLDEELTESYLLLPFLNDGELQEIAKPLRHVMMASPFSVGQNCRVTGQGARGMVRRVSNQQCPMMRQATGREPLLFTGHTSTEISLCIQAVLAEVIILISAEDAYSIPFFLFSFSFPSSYSG